jgi:hypothetical protein
VQSAASVSSARRGTRARTSAVAWQRLTDEALLQVRLRDLNLRVAGTPLARCVRRLYAELEGAGLRFRPHCWLADEWFSPDGIPGIAIPFYLSHPRLRGLERRMMREVEGGNSNWMMRILRHEAGHAIDSAYRLRRRRRWRELFGPASRPYPESYRPRPGSRRFVQHLGSWYAQSHPTEDFAETFAVWLQRGASWRRAYAGWPALDKLRYVDELMREIGAVTPSVRSRAHIDPVRFMSRTLRDYYRHRLARHERPQPRLAEEMILRVFTATPSSPRRMRAATLLRRLKQPVRRSVARRLDANEYLIHQVLRHVIERCQDLGLYARDPVRVARRRIEQLIYRIARLYLVGSAGRHVL